MQTGQKLAELRKNAGLTQEQLAEKLFVSRDLVCKWENGKRRPGKDVLESAAAIFGVDAKELLKNGRELENELSACVPEGVLSASDAAKLIDPFLETLTPRDRSVFMRRYYFYEDAAEIGEKYGISASHVRTVLARARKKLKKFLKEAAT